MRRIEARRKNAKAFRLRHSQSLAKRRQRLRIATHRDEREAMKQRKPHYFADRCEPLNSVALCRAL
jgi:hypothetical protein